MNKIIFIILLSLSLNAVSLRDSVEKTMNANSTIISEKLKIEAYRKYIDIEQSDYKPTLDLESYVERSHTYNKPKNSADNDAFKDGWDVALKFEHILYDGGLTPSEMQQYTHLFNSTKYASLFTIEETVYQLVEAYIDLVSRQELMAMSDDNIKTHEKYLQVAKEKEEISGEVLETHQVNSKYHFVLDRYLEQENEMKNAQSLYKRLTTKEIQGNICRPNINETLIPKTLEEAIDLGVRRSYKVKEQIEKIKEQRELIAQKRSSFLPEIKFQLEGNWNYDLERPEDGKQNIYRSRIFASWNLYEGNKNSHEVEQERIFLKEQQKVLDTVVNEESDNIKEVYQTYFNLKKRHEVKRAYVEDNKNILEIYKTQLEDGTRTFLDILNAESELYRSQLSRIELEFDLIKSYYELMFALSNLSDTILKQENQVCPVYKFEKENDKKVNKLFEGLDNKILEIFEDDGYSLVGEPLEISLEDLEDTSKTNGNSEIDNQQIFDTKSIEVEKKKAKKAKKEKTVEKQIEDIYLNGSL